MQLFKTLNILLKKEKNSIQDLKTKPIEKTEVKSPELINKAIHIQEPEKEVKKETNFVKKDNQHKTSKSEKCYGLFSKNGNSFLAMHNNEKKTFLLNNIEPIERGTTLTKYSDELLRELINKKFIFLDIISKNPDGTEVVIAYSDSAKKNSINSLLDEAINKYKTSSELTPNQSESKSQPSQLKSKIF